MDYMIFLSHINPGNPLICVKQNEMELDHGSDNSYKFIKAQGDELKMEFKSSQSSYRSESFRR
jgi:hypothetical protein